MVEGFADERVDVGEVELRVRHGGEGPPVLLIHGHPWTGSTWHREHELADRAPGRRITGPALFLWSTEDDLETLHGDPLAIWREWATDISGVPITAGHHLAEENPAAVAAALTGFLSG